jgi:flagellar M-ring protein FliF
MNAVVAPYPRWAAGLKPLLLLVGIAVAVAAGVTVVLWSRGPSYSLLYGNLGTEDQAQITQALDTAGIPYQLTPDSSGIEVPSERLSEARLKLAGQGLPEGDGGFSLMTKDAGFGVSQFMENARYQHALEIELAHTIASMRPIDGARVHLAEPPQTAFVRDQIPASASVFVQLKPGRSLSQEQVQAIVNLVASSVPDLTSNEVTVVDQQGQLLSSPQDAESAAREARFELVERLEDDYTQRIEELLTPLVGAGHVQAQVVAELDTSVSEEAREQYQPGSQIVRSEQLSQQTNRGDGMNGGVPGSLSNEPPPAGVAQPPPAPPAAATTAATGAGAAAAGAAAGAQKPGAAPTSSVAQTPESTSTETTRNYEMDRTLDYTRQPAGRVKRVTVAVLIDDIHSVDPSGKPVERPLTQAELAHVTQLVKDAVGFDASRGDSVNVVNSSFQAAAEPAGTDLEQVPIWERPLFLELVKLAAGLIVLLVLALAVLRPLVRALLGPARAALAAPGGTALPSGSAADPALAAPASRAVAQSGAGQPGPAYEQQVSNARALVNQDAKRVAQVVRTWVASDE